MLRAWSRCIAVICRNKCARMGWRSITQQPTLSLSGSQFQPLQHLTASIREVTNGSSSSSSSCSSQLTVQDPAQHCPAASHDAHHTLCGSYTGHCSSSSSSNIQAYITQCSFRLNHSRLGDLLDLSPPSCWHHALARVSHTNGSSGSTFTWPLLRYRLLQYQHYCSRAAPTGKVYSSRQVTAKIMACRTAQELQQLVQRFGQQMNNINLAAAIAHMPKVQSTAAVQQQQLLEELWQLLQPQLEQCGQRELANIIWAFSKLQFMQALPYTACLEQYLNCVAAATPRHIANVVWALCTAPAAIQQQHKAAVLHQLVPAFMQCLDDATAQNIANVAYGVAKSGQQLAAGHLHLMAGRLITVLNTATPQEVANMLWAVATMGQQLQPAQLQQLLEAFVIMRRQAKLQEVSNTLWAVATMGQQMQKEELQQLLDAFVSKLQQAKPQDVSNTLLAVTKMGQQLQAEQLQRLLKAFVGKQQQAKPQEVSNTLWAVATMGQQLHVDVLQQLVQVFAGKLQQANPQEVSNTLWACGKLNYFPSQLLTAPQLQHTVASAKPQELSNIAWACGQLGHRDEQLMGALLHEAEWSMAGGSNRHNTQHTCNLCWAVAVLGLQQHAHKVLQLVQTCSQQWDSMATEGMQQLHQVHMWLWDLQLGGGQGLAGTLTAQQLQQCKAAWDAAQAMTAQAGASSFQTSVFAAVQRLPIQWQQPPKMEQPSAGRDGVVDGACLIDVVGRTAAGVLLAIEADGPSHFRQPDGGLTGSTQYRNRALAARGYTVVGVPWHAWEQLKGRNQQQQYLMQRLKELGAV